MNAHNVLKSFTAATDSGLDAHHAAPKQNNPFSSPQDIHVIQLWDNVPAQTITEAFERGFEKTGCTVVSQDIEGAPAVFTNFTISPGEGNPTFTNEIGLKKNRDSHRSKLSLIHEKFHALQWHAIPELHASLYNRLTFEEAPVILSPKSWILMTLLTERDAYAKSAWLAHLQLGQSYCDEFAEASAKEFVSQNDVAYWQGKFPDDIGFALGEASLVWDQKKNVAGVTLRDHYIDLALKDYEASYRWNKKSGAVEPVFVDLDDEGILSLGASFGPSIFGKYYPDPVFTDLKLSAKQQERLDTLNEVHGIDPAHKLPTLAEALETFSMSKQEFMQRSKSFVQCTAPAPQMALEHAMA